MTFDAGRLKLPAMLRMMGPTALGFNRFSLNRGGRIPDHHHLVLDIFIPGNDPTYAISGIRRAIQDPVNGPLQDFKNAAIGRRDRALLMKINFVLHNGRECYRLN